MPKKIEPKKDGRGGARRGAGSAPKRGVAATQFSLRVIPSLLAQVDAECERRGISRSDLFTELLESRYPDAQNGKATLEAAAVDS